MGSACSTHKRLEISIKLILKLDGKMSLHVLRIAEKTILNYTFKEQRYTLDSFSLDIQQWQADVHKILNRQIISRLYLGW